MSAGLSTHGHRGGHASTRVLRRVLLLNGGFLFVEAAAGWWSGSLALLADAVHMVGDVGALLLAIGAARLAAVPPGGERTFGLVRAETLGAFVNGLLLAGAAVSIGLEAVRRLWVGPPAQDVGLAVLLVAIVGLVVNVASAWWLAQEAGDGDLNLRGAMLHMAADALGSVGAIVAGVLLMRGVGSADAWVSLLISVLVGLAGAGLLRDAGRVLLQLPPEGVHVDQVRATLLKVDGVESVHELHVWTLDGVFGVLTAHLVTAPEALDSPHDLRRIRRAAIGALSREHGLHHVTLQVETPAEAAQAGPPAHD